MDTYSRARRGIALGASGLLVAGATVAMTTATTTSANAGQINKDYNYNCVLSLNGETYKVGITTRVKVPGSVVVGRKVAKRNANLAIHIPEPLHEMVLGLGATSAEGGSSNARVGVKIGKKVRNVPIKNLSAPKAPIPPSGEQWSIATKGTVQAFKVPANAKGGTKARLTMPKAFKIDAVVYLGDTPIPNTLKCTVGKKRALGTINIRKAPSKLNVNIKPKRIVAKKTRARVNVKVNSTGKATGKVRVKQGKKVLGTAKLKAGKATVKLKRFAKPGKRRLTIAYVGNKSVKASTVKRTVRVRK